MGVTNDEDEKLLGTAPDGEEEIETRMRVWAEPIAERLLATEGATPFAALLEPSRPPKEALAEMIGGVTAAFLAEGPSQYLPRAAQETGTGTLRFRRDASGELCLTIDERPDIAQRMSIRDPFIGLLAEIMMPHATCVRACEEVEKAVLAGEAWLPSFAYDASKSTQEEAVYTRAMLPEEVEQGREEWAAHDENVAAMEADHARRVSELKAKIAGLDPEIERRLGAPDDGALYLAYSLLLAQFESFIYDAFYDLAESDEAKRDKATLVLTPDGTIDNGVQVAAGEAVLGRLESDIADCWLEDERPPPAPFDARRLVAWGIEAGRLIPDLFDGMICAPEADGLRVTLGPLEE